MDVVARPTHGSGLDSAALPPDLSVEYLREWRILPVFQAGDRLRVLADHPPDPQVLDDLRWIYGAEPEVEPTTAVELDAALDRVEQSKAETAADLIAALEPGSLGEGHDEAGEASLLARAQQPPVIRLVNLLLLEALEARASDVHLEAVPGGLEVRYRVDGVLLKAPSPPPGLAAAVVSRLKVMAEMDVAERRRPQDGRVRLRLEDRPVDVRVSTL